jgi:hypothetical protein
MSSVKKRPVGVTWGVRKCRGRHGAPVRRGAICGGMATREAAHHKVDGSKGRGRGGCQGTSWAPQPWPGRAHSAASPPGRCGRDSTCLGTKTGRRKAGNRKGSGVKDKKAGRGAAGARKGGRRGAAESGAAVDEISTVQGGGRRPPSGQNCRSVRGRPCSERRLLPSGCPPARCDGVERLQRPCSTVRT